ncbi:hypothetical protein [Flavobacterium ardleyense]|uniref:hypothetical protein n=1 Tax=Flavobacterium ardleyense TaxID=2038737 RepID=UPI00298BD1EC|nr:hypothetical protein [Flavobacterium ardleyense]
MKKFILPVTILIASLTFAPTANAQTKSSEAKTTQEQEAQYKEIQVSEVPTVITDALKKAYPTAILHKASVGTEKDYQLEVEVEGQRGLLFADANGTWLNK